MDPHAQRKRLRELAEHILEEDRRLEEVLCSESDQEDPSDQDQEDDLVVPLKPGVPDRNSWRTPPALFKFLETKYHIRADICASAENALCTNYLTEEDDAMKIDWVKRFNMPTCCNDNRPSQVGWRQYVYINPPYCKCKRGYTIKKWLRKCAQQAKRGCGVIALVPATNGEKNRFAKYVYGQASKIYDVQGRLKFGHPQTGKADKPAPFGCFIVVWDGDNAHCEQHNPNSIKKQTLTEIGPYYP